MLSISHQPHPHRSHKLRANLFQEEKGLFKNTKIRRLSEKDAWFFYTRKYTKPIDFRQGRQIQNWQTDIYFWEGKMPILNTLYLRLTYKTNRSWSCYIFWSDQSPANQWSVSYSLSEPVIDKVTNWAVLERKKIICICKVFWDKRKIIEERENRLRLKERCQTCAALVPELSNKSTKWKYIKQKYKRQIYFSTQFCTILVVTLHSWYQA